MENGINASVEPSPHLFYSAKVMWANPGARATWALRGIGFRNLVVLEALGAASDFLLG